MTRHIARGTVAALAAGIAACAVCSCAASVGHGPASPATSSSAGSPGAASATSSPVGSPGAASATSSPVGSPGAAVAVSVSSFGTPLRATLSWFTAVNAKDRAAAVAHFVPAHADMMNWGNGDTSTWSTFTRLRCKPLSQGTASAAVYCSFDESQSSSEGSPDTFWTVWLARQPDGRWLIDNYGQG